MFKIIHRTCLELSRIKSMGKFFYAVRKGRQSGVFLTWDECQLQVKGFSGAKFKKFGSETEAWDFVNEENGINTKTPGTSIVDRVKDFSVGATARKAAPSLVNHVNTTGGLDRCKSLLQAGQQKNKRSFSTDAANDETETRAKRQKTRKASTSSSSSRHPNMLPREGSLVVYTDGACSNNGFHGAKAGVGVYWGDGHPLNYSARLEGKQTNQRAELTAAIRALEQVKDNFSEKSITLYTDSKYTINCVTDWIHRWQKNGWKTSQKTDVINKPDLIQLHKLNSELDITWEYVPGHKNFAGNEAADKLAREGATQPLPSR